jgi:O-antigen/teichoic acid export membrane protein
VSLQADRVEDPDPRSTDHAPPVTAPAPFLGPADERPDAEPRAGEPANATGLRRDTLVLMAATFVVGVGNYGFSLAVVWLLKPAGFSVVSSFSSLLLVVGSAANAALPWVLASGIRRTRPDSSERRETVGFTVLASLACGCCAAGLVVALSARYASPGAQAGAAVTAFGIFVAGVVMGYLQGIGRFVALAVLTVVEVAIKFGLGMALAAMTAAPAGAMAGSAIGIASVAAYGLLLIRREVRRPSRALVRAATSQAARVGAVQVAVSVLVTLDIIVGSLRHGGSSSLAAYQAMAMFSRLPFFASIAISMVAYPRLTSVASRGRDFEGTAGDALTLYMVLAAGAVAIAATLPAWLLRLVLPQRYLVGAHLLVPLAVAGLAAGLINLTTTFFQAAGRFNPRSRRSCSVASAPASSSAWRRLRSATSRGLQRASSPPLPPPSSCWSASASQPLTACAASFRGSR